MLGEEMSKINKMLVKLSEDASFDASIYEKLLLEIGKNYTPPPSSMIPDSDIKKLKQNIEELKKYSPADMEELLALIEEFGKDKILSFAKKTYPEILNEVSATENLKETKAEYKKSLFKLSSEDNAINLYEKTNLSIKSSIVKIAISNKPTFISNKIYLDDSLIIGAEKSVVNFAFKQASESVKKNILIKNSSIMEKAGKIFRFLPAIGILYMVISTMYYVYQAYSIWSNELSQFSKYGEVADITDPEYVERLYIKNKNDPNALSDIINLTKISSSFTENFVRAIASFIDLLISVIFMKIAVMLAPTVVGSIIALVAEIGLSMSIYYASEDFITKRVSKFNNIQYEIQEFVSQKISDSRQKDLSRPKRVNPSEVVDYSAKPRPRRISPSEVVESTQTPKPRPRRISPDEVR